LIPLDKFIESVMSRQKKANNKIYKSKFYQNRFMQIKQKGLSSMKFFEKDKVKTIKSFGYSFKFSSIYYVRHNDDFLLGLGFEKKIAKAIINEIQVFIKSDLHLGSYDFSFSRGYLELSRFLGFDIGVYPLKRNNKLQQVVHLNKIKASLQRKKIAESEKYFKLVEQISSNMHRHILNSVNRTGQTIFRKLRSKNLDNRNVKVKMLNALKLSLYQMESEVIVKSVTSNIFNTYSNNHSISIFSERQKETSLANLTKKWIQKAIDLAKEEDKVELENAVERYLSPKFLKVREAYLIELDKISSKSFSKCRAELKKMPVSNNIAISSKVGFYKIKILLPLKCLKKSLRKLGVLNKFSMRPTSKPILGSLKDYEIISWYNVTAKRL
jgi:hypothetical protein